MARSLSVSTAKLIRILRFLIRQFVTKLAWVIGDISVDCATGASIDRSTFPLLGDCSTRCLLVDLSEFRQSVLGAFN